MESGGSLGDRRFDAVSVYDRGYRHFAGRKLDMCSGAENSGLSGRIMFWNSGRGQQTAGKTAGKLLAYRYAKTVADMPFFDRIDFTDPVW